MVETALALILPVIGAVVWLVRLEGRVNTQEAVQREVITRIDGRLVDLNGKMDQLVERVDRLLASRVVP